MMHKLSTLARDESGASIIEMALVAPFLAALVIGMVDISRGYNQTLFLEQAAQRSIEKVMQAKKQTSLYQTLKTEAATAAGVAESAVTVDWWLECAGVRQAGYDDAVCPTGVPYARYVTVVIQKTYTPMFSTRFAGANSDGTFTLKGKAGIRVQ